MLHGEGGDLFQLLGGMMPPVGFVGKFSAMMLGLRRDGFLDIGSHEREIVFLTLVFTTTGTP
jgi:hypothetical protein